MTAANNPAEPAAPNAANSCANNVAANTVPERKELASCLY